MIERSDHAGGARTARPEPDVLIADNDPEVVALIEAVLRRKGLVVEKCLDGADAWQRLNTRSFRIFVCDLNMPGRSGQELIEALAPRANAPRVVVVSGFLEDGQAERLENQPHVAFVRSKPFDVLRFADDVLELVGKGGAEPRGAGTAC
jgi:CheY-like chemotaxis protein